MVVFGDVGRLRVAGGAGNEHGTELVAGLAAGGINMKSARAGAPRHGPATETNTARKTIRRVMASPWCEKLPRYGIRHAGADVRLAYSQCEKRRRIPRQIVEFFREMAKTAECR